MTVSNARQAHQLNRVAWNQGAEAYTAALDQQVARLRTGEVSLHPIEQAHLGDLGQWCQTAVHLQCASGEDTLSLLNAGVRHVVGVDISDVHIANAEATAAALASDDARWYCCDVLDTPEELNGWADLVYTGRGALVWLHDLTAWGQVVARLLKPGGVFHILDDHPVAYLFDPEAADLTPSRADYFHHVETYRGWTPEYLGDLGRPIQEHAEKHGRFWTLSEVFTALTSAGLVVNLLDEHPDPYWPAFPHLPETTRRTLPMAFSLRARKPDASAH